MIKIYATVGAKIKLLSVCQGPQVELYVKFQFNLNQLSLFGYFSGLADAKTDNSSSYKFVMGLEKQP